MKTFAAIWLGQTISMMGSSMTGFALGVWVYNRTGSVTQLALISFFSMMPTALVSPFAGVLVDRWNRRLAMILSDGMAAIGTLAALVLLYFDNLQIGTIYILVVFVSSFTALQMPAYLASMSMLVPKQQLGRANGLNQLSMAGIQLVSPLLGGILVDAIGLKAVLLADFGSFLVGVVILLMVRIPSPKSSPTKDAATLSYRREITAGWRFVKGHAGLLLLLGFYGLNTFVNGTMLVLIKPIVLSFSSAAALGGILSLAGLGMLLGSAFMGLWGGSRHLIRAMLLTELISGIAFVIAGWRASLLLLAAGTLIYNLAAPIYTSCSHTFWQKKTPPEIQGRVFALLRTVSGVALAVAYLVSGPMADHIFQPAMAPDGWLATSFGAFLGTGPGRGYGLMFVVFGALTSLLTILVFLHPRVRKLDSEIPDSLPEQPTQTDGKEGDHPDLVGSEN